VKIQTARLTIFPVFFFLEFLDVFFLALCSEKSLGSSVFAKAGNMQVQTK
jgi:hypothetical protein